MQNPPLVVLTGRNDLDDQLFGQFQRCADILGQTPVQAANPEQLRELLAVARGGVVFATIQKFLPGRVGVPPAGPGVSPGRTSDPRGDASRSSGRSFGQDAQTGGRDAHPTRDDDAFGGTPLPISERRNIIVIADEAHRSQYDLIDGLARHLRDVLSGVSFIGFTGTPIEKMDAATKRGWFSG